MILLLTHQVWTSIECLLPTERREQVNHQHSHRNQIFAVYDVIGREIHPTGYRITRLIVRSFPLQQHA